MTTTQPPGEGDTKAFVADAVGVSPRYRCTVGAEPSHHACLRPPLEVPAFTL
jgi:hypothetical protein